MLKDKNSIINNILKVARQMSSFEQKLMLLSLEGLNDSFNEWESLSSSEKRNIKEAFINVILLAEEGKKI
tara:strand:- start:129 stop:338 length:210 start_codon:yes stop_codon:yes gene_type:complete